MDEHTEMHVIPFALAIGRAFPDDGPAPTADQLEELFRNEWVFKEEKPVGLGILSYYVARELRIFYSKTDTADGDRPTSSGP